MAETTLDYLKRRLDSETLAKELLALPPDFYSSISAYSQRLKRESASGVSEVSVSLAITQSRMIRSMVRQLLELRIRKALRQGTLSQLLPEERYVCSAEQLFSRRIDLLTDAVSGGQPSFVEFAHLAEMKRNITLRFLRHVDEIIGLDLRRYGPFEIEDVASIPAASADVLIAEGDAVEVITRD